MIDQECVLVKSLLRRMAASDAYEDRHKYEKKICAVLNGMQIKYKEAEEKHNEMINRAAAAATNRLKAKQLELQLDEYLSMMRDVQKAFPGKDVNSVH